MNALIKYRGFVEAVKTGSITSAADSLNYSQSGISHMISSLEEDFGFPLLNRAKSGVVLTDEGKHIFDLCEKLLETQDQIQGTVEQINGSVIGTIRIGAYYSVLMEWFPRIIEEINKRYPKLDLQIVEGSTDELFDMMHQNTIDAGILSYPVSPDFSFTPLSKDPIVAIMPKGHPLAEKDLLDITDLLPYPFLVEPEHAQGILKEVLESQPAQTSKRLSVRSDYFMLYMIGKGYGIGMVGEMVAKNSPYIEYRHFSKDYHRTIGIAVPNWKPQTIALRSFLGIVRELYQTDSYFAVPTKML